MHVHGGLGGRHSPIWPTWAKTEEGMLTQRKTGMLFPQERKWTHSRKITNRHDLSWGPNAKGLTLGYNIFLEAKGEEVILFPLPRASLPERSLTWGQEEDTRCSSMGCGLKPHIGTELILERTSYHVWEEAGIWEAPNVKAVPWANQWQARGWVWCLSPLLGPSSTPSSLESIDEIAIPGHSPPELLSSSVWSASTLDLGPTTAVLTGAAR